MTYKFMQFKLMHWLWNRQDDSGILRLLNRPDGSAILRLQNQQFLCFLCFMSTKDLAPFSIIHHKTLF